MSMPELPPNGPALSEIAAETLAAYVQDTPEAALLHQANEHHYYWTELRRRPLPFGLDARVLWQVARQQRRQTAWHLEWASGAERWRFSYNLPRPLQQLLYELDQRLGRTGGASDAALRGPDRLQLLVNARMEEAIASSQIEGASTTREAAKALLRARRKPLNRSERMIVNNYQTMRHLQNLVQRPIEVADLLALQALVTDRTLDRPEQSGHLRDTDTIAVVDHASSELVYQPPGHQHLLALLRQFCALANDEQSGHHPLVVACMLHFLMGFLHPFADGNGRTARAVFYWYLLRRGYALVEFMPLSRIIKRSVVQYGRAYLFAEADGNDLTYFIKYKLHVLQQAHAELQAYVARQRQQTVQTQHLLLAGLNERQLQLLQPILENPDTLLTILEV